MKTFPRILTILTLLFLGLLFIFGWVVLLFLFRISFSNGALYVVSFFLGLGLIALIPFVAAKKDEKTSYPRGYETNHWGPLIPDRGEQKKNEKIMPTAVSNIWYLLPIFFSILGGIIGYVAVKDTDIRKAKDIIYVGLIIFFFEVFLLVVYWLPR